MGVRINARTVVFIALTVLLCLCAMGFACGVAEETYPADSVDDVYVDGADFTGLFQLGAEIINVMIAVLTGLIGFVIMTVGACVTFLVLRLASVRKTSLVTEDELNLCQIVLWGVTGTFFLLAQLLTHFQIAWFVGLLFWQIPAFGYLFQIWGLKRVMSGELKIDIPVTFI